MDCGTIMLTEDQIAFLGSLWESSRPVEYRRDEKRVLTEPEPYEGQEKIVNYLRHAGFMWVVRMSGGGIKCDGDFRWPTELADEVESKNIRLDPEFERAIIGDRKRMTRLRRAMLDHGIHTWDL